jgi:hypothetical protein
MSGLAVLVVGTYSCDDLDASFYRAAGVAGIAATY